MCLNSIFMYVFGLYEPKFKYEKMLIISNEINGYFNK